MIHQPQSRRSFIKTTGAALCSIPFLSACATTRPRARTLRHLSFGTGGMAWNDLTMISKCDGVEIVAVCDVDLERTAEARKLFPKARVYQDWREALRKEADNIDSVNVSTPDHMHAPIAMSAMRLGKHVYGQKPLAHNLFEVRRMTEMSREKGLVTQMGIQIHSTAPYRTAVALIKNGMIGKVKEVHSWCPKTWGDASPKPDRNDPVPPQFNWDLWLGVCAERPFIGDQYYHPSNWRKRLDFGTGTLGDMGCHIFDPVFSALGLASPISVRSEGPAPNEWNWALDECVHYAFRGTRYTASHVLPVTWYDGAAKPPAAVLALLEGAEVPENGSILIGTQGVMVLPHIGAPQLFPRARFADYNYKKVKVEGDDHWALFVAAAKGEGKTTANFSYAGPLTETILLGGIATRFPHTTLEWNAKRMTFNLSEANQFVRRQYREGWAVKGLG